MIQEPATDDMYDELIELAKQYCGDPPVRETYIWDQARAAPAEAASNLLCVHALGEITFTQEQVAHLWLVGFTEGYPPEEIIPDSVLARARPERRTRPPAPLLFPLRGGGHKAGEGTPGKREFPARWDDDTTIGHIMSVATDPDGAVQQPDGTFRAWGIRDGVDLRVILTSKGDVETAYPVAGEGVVTNPLDDVRAPLVGRIRALITETAADEDTRAALQELVDAGEWDQALGQLDDLGQRDVELLRLAGL